jgi:hypothetical protein
MKHLVAMREPKRLNVNVDGKLAAESSQFSPDDYDVSTEQPVCIGFGQTDYFAGQMSDVRLYNRALTDVDIRRYRSHGKVLSLSGMRQWR